MLSDLIPTQQAEHRDLREGEAGVTLCLAAGLQATLLSRGWGGRRGRSLRLSPGALTQVRLFL